jgi:hypothetical protein
MTKQELVDTFVEMSEHYEDADGFFSLMDSILILAKMERIHGKEEHWAEFKEFISTIISKETLKEIRKNK